MTVVAAGELQELVALRCTAREAYRAHPSLGPRRYESHSLDIGDHLNDRPGHFDFQLARGPEGRSAPGGICDRSHDLGVGVAEQQRAPALDEVDVLVSIDIGNRCTGCPLDEERMRTDRVEGPNGRRHSSRHQIARFCKELLGAGVIELAHRWLDTRPHGAATRATRPPSWRGR